MRSRGVWVSARASLGRDDTIIFGRASLHRRIHHASHQRAEIFALAGSLPGFPAQFSRSWQALIDDLPLGWRFLPGNPMTTLDLPVAHAANRLHTWTKVLCALFFFSGFPALIYQLTWQRELFRIFGVNSESVTIVVTAFMLGLGLGGLAGGWASKRRGISLLPLLAAIELTTAAFGIVSLSVFERVGAFVINWPLPAMAAVNLLLVIVPTLLMGATLPILVSHLVRRSGQVGAAVGLLYYGNTLRDGG